jgi:hypothetical protein
MATNLVVNFIGKNNLSKTTAVMGNDLKKFGRIADNVGRTMNKSLGALGLGLGLATLTSGLKQATKAASDDRKSQGLLAQALQKTVGATSSAIAGAESYIKKTQLQTAVLDDELRPALATAVRATGSLAGGQRLLDAALDVSASTGKDLSSVTGALSKAFNGNQGALKKLVPGLKLTGDVLGDVERGFDGAAERAADLDPYKRLEVIFADIQETVGTQLLPVLEEFSAYLTSPEGQKNLEQIVGVFVAMGRAVADVTRFIIDNITYIKAGLAAVVALRIGWSVTTGIVALYRAGVISATIATKALKVALISTGIGAIAVAVGFLAEAWINATEAQEDYTDGQPSQAPTINYAIPDLYGNIITDPAILAERAAEAADAAKEAADKVRKALDEKIGAIKRTAENFRDAIGLAFGTFGKDENSVFNADVVINKLKRIVEAAKGFAGNIARLRKAGADESVISEIVGMGPAQGNIVAKGLLGSGKLSEYLKLRGSLYDTGAQVGAQQAMATSATYEININKSVVSASDIIREIQKYEKQTKRKYLVG